MHSHISKHKLPILLFAGICLLSACYTNKLSKLAPTEQYPDDTWLSQQTNKRALIIVAHDDDALGCAGTITQLCEQGWQVSMFCLYPDISRVADRNAQRQIDIKNTIAIQGIQDIRWHEFIYRKDLETSQTAYYPVPESSFDTLFFTDTLLSLINAHIEDWKPSVIFTLDDQIGGYGHPEHKYISMLALRCAKEHQLAKGGTVERVYQAVFSPSQAETSLKDSEVYQAAKEVYHCQGMPIPTTQINIQSAADKKYRAMQAYTTEQPNIMRVWLFYNKVDADTYFNIFDREFFRVIETGE